MALTKYEIQRRLLNRQQVPNTTSVANTEYTTPSLTIATESGAIAAGAKLAVFTIYPGTEGTILGTTITPELNVVEFPFNSSGYDQIPYTITAGTIVITSAT